jgi:hypothetical protein
MTWLLWTEKQPVERERERERERDAAAVCVCVCVCTDSKQTEVILGKASCKHWFVPLDCLIPSDIPSWFPVTTRLFSLRHEALRSCLQSFYTGSGMVCLQEGSCRGGLL